MSACISACLSRQLPPEGRPNLTISPAFPDQRRAGNPAKATQNRRRAGHPGRRAGHPEGNHADGEAPGWRRRSARAAPRAAWWCHRTRIPPPGQALTPLLAGPPGPKPLPFPCVGTDRRAWRAGRVAVVIGRRIAQRYEVKVNALLDRAEDPARYSTAPAPGSGSCCRGSAAPARPGAASRFPHAQHGNEG